MIPGSANPLLLTGAAEAEGYAIERSLRFNSADSAYLSRTPASTGNRKTWSFSLWVKRSGVDVTGSDVGLWSTYSGSNPATTAYFNSSGTITFYDYTTSYQFRLVTTPIYRDPSAWYHLLFVVDTTQATASDRLKLYVNGEQVTTFSTASYPSQNHDTNWNSTTEHQIGNHASYFNGYLADIHFIDGQALDPTSFGEFDTNGIWQPKAYTGTYGTNGFHLDFSDNSTDAALGTDTSGNGNDWTVNNISVTIGTQPALYSSPNLYTSAADVIANGTPLSSGSTFSNVYVYLVTNGGGDIGSKVFTADGSGDIGTTWTWLHRIGGAWTFSGSYNNAEWDLFTWGSQPTATNYIMNNSAPLHMLVDNTGSVMKVTGTIATFNSTPNTGKDNDSLVDVPTNGTETDTGLGGEVRGNYCTWNPLALKGNTVLSNGNLDVDSSSTAHGHCGGTIAVTSGKWYWEITKNTNTVSTAIGLGGAQASLVPNPASTYIGNAAGKNFIYLQSNIVYMYDGANSTSATSSSAANDSGTFMFALDMDNAKFWVGKDGTWFQYGALSGGDPGTGSNPVFTQITSGVPYLPIVNSYANGNSLTANFGQRPFAYTAPSGFKALCTANLPGTTITTSGSYTGNGVADGPFVYLNGVPTAMTVGGNSVTLGTDADKLSNGFKIRTTSTTYNQNANTYNYTITSTGAPFKTARAQPNP